MATRVPLIDRHGKAGQQATTSSLSRSTIKRARSPDPLVLDASSASTTKRARSGASSAQITATTGTINRDDRKERRQQDRLMKEAEFRAKYTRAFPTFVFFLDAESLDASGVTRKSLELKINQLSGNIEDFFSNNITHLITNKAEKPSISLPPDSGKENVRSKLLRSPSKRATNVEENIGDPVANALSWGAKIWSVEKFLSVLNRCLPPPTKARALPLRNSNSVPLPHRDLGRMLENERLNGTSERDPTQRRHNFTYFSRNTYFVLIEDVKQELATIAAQEYAVPRGYSPDQADMKVPWPVPYCHPRARGPFVMFDDKERRRWEKSQREKEKDQEDRDREQKQRMQVMLRKAQTTSTHDLRRSVSLSNLHRHAEDLARDAVDQPDSACASGFMPSGYIAASGNSLVITSTTGTTSTSGYPQRSVPGLRSQREVITSRKAFTAASTKTHDDDNSNAKMGPPTALPRRLLKKSKSTTTMRLPKQEEASKPGYCESCRVRFEDFRVHTTSKRHFKFASTDANFSSLDVLLSSVQRRTVHEVEEQHMMYMEAASDIAHGRSVSPIAPPDYIDLDDY